jgi:hypothetical protein
MVSVLLMWGALSDEKSGLYFPVFVEHRQRRISQIRVAHCTLATAECSLGVPRSISVATQDTFAVISILAKSRKQFDILSKLQQNIFWNFHLS